MHRSALVSLVLFSSLVACSGAEADKGGPAPLKDGSVTTPGEETGGPVEDTGGFNVADVMANETTTGGCIGSDPDCDMDGYRASEDCDDRDGTINPDAYDFEGDGVDNDCDGTKDNPVKNCEPTLGSTTPLDFARAADLCPQRSKSKKYGGIYDPAFKVEFGSVGGATSMNATKILAKFGDNLPRAGSSLFGMQSGPLLATKPREAKPIALFPVSNACSALPLLGDDCKSLSNGTSPLPGFPTNVQDVQEVRMYVRVPSNAKAMSFDFAFFSTEFNEYWNSPFNDAFFALVTSKKIDRKNVAKDSKGLALTVNSGFFQLCPAPPGPSGLSKPEALSKAPCVGVNGNPSATPPVIGTLKGTYFDGEGIGSTDDTISTSSDAGTTKYVYGGGSGWLTTKFEVEPGESLIIRFMVMDTSDGALDSAAIVDNIRWDKAPPKVPTGEVERPPM
jgi:hypothetical protein